MIWPQAVEIVPTSVVEALIARSNAELDALRSELARALREADEAEERLRLLPSAVVYDSISETQLLDYVAEIAARLRHEPVGDWHGLPVPEPVDVHGAVSPRWSSAEANGLHPMGFADVPAPQQPGPWRIPTDGSDRPRTVVVDRSTTGGSAQWPPPPSPALRLPPPSPLRLPPPPPSPPPVGPAPRAASRPAPSAESALVEWAGGSERPDGGPITRKEWSQPGGRWLHKVPSRLLMQLGVLVIIVGLLVFKLG